MNAPPQTINDSMWLGNKRVAPSGDKFLPVDEASTGTEIARLRNGTPEDVDRAFAAARDAQASWANIEPQQRADVLKRACLRLEERAAEIADLITSEVGTVAAQSRGFQVESGLRAIRSTASAVEVVEHVETIGASTVIKQPAGVVGAITPWNYPLFQVALKVAPALVAGCAVVLKPPSVAPLTSFIIAETLAEGGLPPNVFNIVCGSGSVVGNAIASHPDADFVSFTGSVAAGRQVARASAVNGTRTALELGGKSAAVVLDEHLLEPAVRQTIASCFANTGQTCAALSRIIVPRSLLADAEKVSAEVVGNVVIGDPRHPETTLGPLSNAGQQETVLGHLRAAEETPGVRMVAQTVPPDHVQGWYVPATVLTSDNARAPIVQEEVFGPVLVIQPYDDVDRALELANDSPFGLIARVWTDDNDQFADAASRLRVGGVIQSDAETVWDAPFGGVKFSGYGRERGPHGVEEYLVLKSIQPTNSNSS